MHSGNLDFIAFFGLIVFLLSMFGFLIFLTKHASVSVAALTVLVYVIYNSIESTTPVFNFIGLIHLVRGFRFENRHYHCSPK